MKELLKTRRDFLKWAGMWGSVIASYSVAAVFGFRFIFPKKKKKLLRNIYVTQTSEITDGKSYRFITPNGQTVLINRLNGIYKAFSNVCPHLGCKVKWKHEKRFFHCPCHDGQFNAHGEATAGPPLQANQKLKEYTLNIKEESLYLSVEAS